MPKKAPDSFNHKKFFQLCGLTKKSAQEVKTVFGILDNDGSGFIEEEELKYDFIIYYFFSCRNSIYFNKCYLCIV